MNRDTLVGIAGAVVLVAAMAGIFWYEGTQAPSALAPSALGTGPFAVTWKEASLDGPAASGALDEDQSTEEVVDIGHANLTRIAFVLTWTDDAPQSGADRFKVEVVSPGGEVREGSGDGGKVEVVVDGLNAVPQVERTGGANEADASARLAQSASATNGTGVWTVRILLEDAGDATPVAVLGPLADGGNPWSLATRLTVYQAEVRAA